LRLCRELNQAIREFIRLIEYRSAWSRFAGRIGQPGDHGFDQQRLCGPGKSERNAAGPARSMNVMRSDGLDNRPATISATFMAKLVFSSRPTARVSAACS